ncbi:MAG TPA: DUF2393 family protein [Terriglobales bacterium]|nr:DUF2393 family protein [Terriglobales bacterium]
MAEPLSSAPQHEPSRGPWLGLGIGALIVVGIISYLVYASRSSPTRHERRAEVMQSAPADPYAANLPIAEIKMFEAENFVGGKAVYVEGKITNTGDKTVTGATVEGTFKNSLDQVVQRENHNLMVIQAREPAVDVVALSAAPLKPGESKEFRMTFEHISADWNGQYPQVAVKLVTTK